MTDIKNHHREIIKMFDVLSSYIGMKVTIKEMPSERRLRPFLASGTVSALRVDNFEAIEIFYAEGEPPFVWWQKDTQVSLQIGGRTFQWKS